MFLYGRFLWIILIKIAKYYCSIPSMVQLSATRWFHCDYLYKVQLPSCLVNRSLQRAARVNDHHNHHCLIGFVSVFALRQGTKSALLVILLSHLLSSGIIGISYHAWLSSWCPSVFKWLLLAYSIILCVENNGYVCILTFSSVNFTWWFTKKWI